MFGYIASYAASQDDDTSLTSSNGLAAVPLARVAPTSPSNLISCELASRFTAARRRLQCSYTFRGKGNCGYVGYVMFLDRFSYVQATYAIYTSPNHAPVAYHLPTLIVTPYGTSIQLTPQVNRSISCMCVRLTLRYSYIHTNYNNESYLLTPYVCMTDKQVDDGGALCRKNCSAAGISTSWWAASATQ